ncbi:unnamed protein product [Scytosiphon promiscuus]
MASVMLGDLDDFIAPGQACINPLFTTAADAAPAKAAAEEKPGGAAMVLELEDDGGPLDAMVVEEVAKPDLIRASNTQTAKVSLDDCLACSGCVTSAETVLITQQSTTKLREEVQSGRHSVIVASITPQARASLAERFGLSPAETHAGLLAFLRERHGVHFLIDSSLGADFSLLEAGAEFVQRWRRRLSGGSVGEAGEAPAAAAATAWVAPLPTVALSSTRRFNIDLGREEDNQMQHQHQQHQQQGNGSDGGVGVGGGSGGPISGKRGREGAGPAASGSGSGGGGPMHVGAKQDLRSTTRGPGELLVLTSACPGWVCYAEKTAQEALPFMSTVKSPQQIMGVLAKRVFPRAWNSTPAVVTATGGSVESSSAAVPTTEDRANGSIGATPAAAAAPTTENGTLPPPTPPPVSSPQRQSEGVFHVSIAQCYDKKLEASRKDFKHEDLGGDAEVDLVLTTAEVLELIEESASAGAGATASGTGSRTAADGSTRADSDFTGVFFRRHCNSGSGSSSSSSGSAANPADLGQPLAPGFPAGQAATASEDGLSLYGGVDGEGASGGGSGGYLEYVFRHAAAELFGVDLAGRPLVYRAGRNSDFRETTLEVEGKVVLRFAYAYGFRNIQSILAKARRGKCPYHFVEVMACPSGCVNGGGQIKPKKEGPRDTKQRVERVSEVLRNGRVPRGPRDNPLVRAVYSELVGGDPGGRKARELLHTSYHNVPKLELSNPHMSPW